MVTHRGYKFTVYNKADCSEGLLKLASHNGSLFRLTIALTTISREKTTVAMVTHCGYKFIVHERRSFPG